MNDDDEFEDDYVRTVPCRPFTFWSLITFVLNLIMGLCRAVLIATDQLNDDVIGASGFALNKKEFADQARQDIESIPATTDATEE